MSSLRTLAVAGVAALVVVGLPLLVRAASEPKLDRYRWEMRPILVFADAPDDPRLAEQLRRFEQAEAQLRDRDNVVIVDTEEGSDLRRRFSPEGFTVILVGKDGGEKHRSGRVVEVDDLNRLIDSMPMRQREMIRRRPAD